LAFLATIAEQYVKKGTFSGTFTFDDTQILFTTTTSGIRPQPWGLKYILTGDVLVFTGPTTSFNPTHVGMVTLKKQK